MIGAGQRATLVVAGLLALVATGCWTQAGQGSGRQGFNSAETTITAANVGDLELAWSRTGGNPAREPVVGRGQAFLRNSGLSVDLATGAHRWGPTSLPGIAVSALADARLLVPTSYQSCSLTAVDTESGTPVGSVQLGLADLSGQPNGFSWCDTTDALAAGGSVIVSWGYLGQVDVPHCDGGATGATFGIFVGITAVDPTTLAIQWERRDGISGCGSIPFDEPWPEAFGSATEVAGGRIVVTQGNHVVALDPASCSTVACPTAWTRDLGVALVGPPIAVRDQVAVVDAIGTVHVLDAATGAPAWTGGVSDAAAAPLASDGETIFAAGADGTLAAFAAAGCGASVCSPEWSAQTSVGASARPSIGGDVVYVGTGDGTVFAFPAKGCAAAVCTDLWTTQPGGGSVTGAPVIVGGRVLFGTEDGTTWAYALPVST